MEPPPPRCLDFNILAVAWPGRSIPVLEHSIYVKSRSRHSLSHGTCTRVVVFNTKPWRAKSQPDNTKGGGDFYVHVHGCSVPEVCKILTKNHPAARAWIRSQHALSDPRSKPPNLSGFAPLYLAVPRSHAPYNHELIITNHDIYLGPPSPAGLGSRLTHRYAWHGSSHQSHSLLGDPSPPPSSANMA